MAPRPSPSVPLDEADVRWTLGRYRFPLLSRANQSPCLSDLPVLVAVVTHSGEIRALQVPSPP